MPHLESAVFMGVAGCGKSTVAAGAAARLGWQLIEGDEFHSEASRTKMRNGIALDDDDRAQWLAELGRLLAERHRAAAPVAMTCSALKRRYRDQLRAFAPGVRFVFLEIDREEARRRVAARGGAHLFPTSLVDSQFEALEVPNEESGVLCVDATRELKWLIDETVGWLTGGAVS